MPAELCPAINVYRYNARQTIAPVRVRRSKKEIGMKQLYRLVRPAWAAILLVFSLHVQAQAPLRQPASRLTGPIVSNGARTVIPGSHPPRVDGATDLGVVSSTQPLNGVTLVFNRSPAQEADLQTLLAAQVNPASSLYRQWLTPDQFGARFGMTDADLGAVQAWLQSQGFTIGSVSRSRTRLTFSGSAGQVAAAFGAPLHHFTVGGQTHMAPATDLALPATLAPLVTAVLHLSDFRPHPALRQIKPAFTSGKTQDHYLTPLDLATMYDVTPVYNAGFNGTGQTVAIVGQSFIDVGDISRFQAAEGLTTNLPSLVLYPGSGVSAAVPDGNEAESDLDLEYSSGMARGARFFFVYTGDDQNFNVTDAIIYAVDDAIAPIISSSYGDCEIDQGAANANAFNQIGEQANSQGQTIFSAAGDNGSTDCAGDAGLADLNSVQLQSLSVDVPASLPTVTALGGLQMTSGASAAGANTYWSGASGSDAVSSLLSYVPEVVWNEDSANNGLVAGGGGASMFFPQPSWQAGIPGIAAGSTRLIPDVSLQASTGNPGYVICTSDLSALQSFGITTSCTQGFRDATTGNLEAGYGGTSFAAPIMAGMFAVLNQATSAGGLATASTTQTNVVSGQGNINPTLYALAANPTTYASVFHDITLGTNACTANTVYVENGQNLICTSGSTGYAAGAGYDAASGLGSIDFAKLVAAWPVATAAIAGKAASTTTLSAASATLGLNSSDVITITVASASATGATPTGTLSLLVDDNVAVTLTLTNGQASYTFPGASVAGSYPIQATYSGDGNYLPSSGAVSVTAGTIVTAGAFTLTAQNITVATNNVATGNINVTPGTGYTGVVTFSLAAPANSPAICYATIEPVSTFYKGAQITGETTLEIGEGTVCTSGGSGPQFRTIPKTTLHAANQAPAAPAPLKRTSVVTAFAGLLLAGLAFRRRSRGLSSLLATFCLAVFGLGLSGCGSGSTPTRIITPTGPATYTLTVTGTDSVTSSIVATTNLTLTIN